MRQIGLAMMQYVEDFDERYPTGSRGFLGQGWASTIFPYVKSVGAFDCPDDTTTTWPSGSAITYPVSYAGNLNFLRTDSGSSTDPHYGQAMSVLMSPSRTVMLCEVKGIHADIEDPNEAASNLVSSVTNGALNGTVYPWADSTSTGGSLMTGCLGGLDCSAYVNNPSGEGFYALKGLHSEGSNFLMCDGHVKWLKGSSVSGGANAMAEDCNQWGSPAVSDCGANEGMAAGTGNNQFAVTFSVM